MLSKLFAEMVGELLRSQYGMQVFLPRLSNAYGPRDKFEPGATCVIPSMLAGIAAGRVVKIWGDGSQRRSFIHIQDLVSATLAMVQAGKFATFNVGSIESVSIMELALMLFEIWGESPRIRFVRCKPAGVAKRSIDFGRVAEVTGLVPRPLRTGLRETAGWYRRYAGLVASREGK